MVKRMAKRPAGITAIAILQLLNSIFVIGFGALMLVFAIVFYVLQLEVFFNTLGTFMIVLGFIGIILFIGLLKMKGWAPITTILFNIMSIILAVFNIVRVAYVDLFNLGSIFLSTIIIIYLSSARKHFK
jgi:hypothetical protein